MHVYTLDKPRTILMQHLLMNDLMYTPTELAILHDAHMIMYALHHGQLQ